ncbi:sulfatase family protein [Steroidobacter cummioxidans]|uniref:sulfatase family protein n=1 Tax=Steroidobacter cummioxidans TaxID=1803913 RepID=UPI000E312BD5|nr:sulfatase-like hydrolase/transferase [Steroidobacter cummioxidans]
MIGRKSALAGTLLACCCLVLASCATPEASSQAQRPKNILFILVDDLGYADFSVTGNRKVQTPNIDSLAQQGMLMTQFTVASPICSASRAALMTGKFSAETRIVSFISNRKHNEQMGQANWLDPKLPTLPRALHDAGYATAHIGKWHLGGGRDIGEAPLPAEYGFDESYTQFEGLGPRVLMKEDTAKLASQSAALGRGPIEWLPKSSLTERYVSKTLDFIERSADRPWFVQLWLDDVHDPWHPDEAQLQAAPGKGDDADEERFFAVLVGMDAQIGRLIERLRATGKLDDTLIVLTGDNGPSGAGQYYQNGATPPGDAIHFRGRKGSLYEGGVREPLIVHWPKRIAPGQQDATTIANGVDLFPTLAQLGGAKLPEAIDGVSLASAWSGQPLASRPDIYYAYGGFGVPGKSPRPYLDRDVSPPFAVRSGEWKLLARGDGTNAELYNLATDPSESRNVAQDNPQIAESLTEKVVRWRKTLPQ